MKNDTVFSLNLARNTGNVKAYLAYVFDGQYQEILNEVDKFLHPNERDYFNYLKSEKRRFSYLTGRFAGKLAVSEYLGEIDLQAIEIRSGIFDQPIVNHYSRDTPEITISHCSDLAVALAFHSGHPMGVDIEEIDFSKTHVFKSQLTASEIAKTEKKFEDPRIGCHLVWTAKEALSKVLKCGLTVPFEILEIEEFKVLEKNSYMTSYKNFAQYKCLSWKIENHLFSITLPKKTEMSVDIPAKLTSGNERPVNLLEKSMD